MTRIFMIPKKSFEKLTNGIIQDASKTQMKHWQGDQKNLAPQKNTSSLNCPKPDLAIIGRRRVYFTVDREPLDGDKIVRSLPPTLKGKATHSTGRRSLIPTRVQNLGTKTSTHKKKVQNLWLLNRIASRSATRVIILLLSGQF